MADFACSVAHHSSKTGANLFLSILTSFVIQKHSVDLKLNRENVVVLRLSSFSLLTTYVFSTGGRGFKP